MVPTRASLPRFAPLGVSLSCDFSLWFVLGCVCVGLCVDLVALDVAVVPVPEVVAVVVAAVLAVVVVVVLAVVVVVLAVVVVPLVRLGVAVRVEELRELAVEFGLVGW